MGFRNILRYLYLVVLQFVAYFQCFAQAEISFVHADTFALDTVKFKNIQNIDSATILGRYDSGSVDIQSLKLGSGFSFSHDTINSTTSNGDKGDVTVSGGSWTIDANSVTYGKIQNASANTILGNNTGGSATVREVALSNSELLGRGSSGNISPITLGSGLSMSGTTISASGSSPSIITPSLLTADQDDWNPTGFSTATIVRVSGDWQMRAITSMAAQSDGKEIKIINVGSYPLYFPGEHPDGTAANRIASGQDIWLFPGDALTFYYDGTSSRWRCLMNESNNLQKPSKGLFFENSVIHPTNDYWTFSSARSGSVAAAQASNEFGECVRLSTATSAGGTAYGYLTPGNYEYTDSCAMSFYCQLNISIDTSTSTERFRVYIDMINTVGATETSFNCIGIMYSDSLNNGNFTLYTTNNSGSQTTVNTNIHVYALKTYKCQIDVDKDLTECRFYINNIYAGRITTNLPSSFKSLTPRAMIRKTAGTTTRYMDVNFMGVRAIRP